MSAITDLPAGCEWLYEETTEDFDWESTQCMAKFIVPWGARDAFRIVVGGTPQTFTVGTASYTRIVPLAYPFYANCYAYKLSMRGEGACDLAADGRSISYDYALATVWFRTPPWRVDSPYPLVTLNRETNADMVTRPGTAYKFPSDGLILPQNIGVRVPVTEYLLTFYQVPAPNDTLYRSLAGYTNLTTFLGCDPGTIQYVGPADDGVLNSWGATSWTMRHRFRWRGVPHNQIMRPDGTAFEAPVSLGTGDPLLPIGELNQLWTG